MTPRTLLIAPPPCKPSEPSVSAGAAAEVLRRMGGQARSIDASIGWHAFCLQPDRLERAIGNAVARGWSSSDVSSLRAAARALRQRPTALQRPETYLDRNRYTSAVNELENALRATAAPYPGVRLGVAMIALEQPMRRVESSAVLDAFSRERGPFDDYFEQELIAHLTEERPDRIGISVSFQQQMPAAARLARLLAQRLPGIPRLLGGPLVAAWKAAGIRLDRAPFDAFDRVVAGDDADLQSLAASGVEEGLTERGLLSPAIEEVSWDAYLSPVPVVPAALGRGCYWRRCTFCPDHMHPAHNPCAPEALPGWLRSVAAAFPKGAMLHLTDSALPPAHLERIAATIRDENLPLRWHGFVRLEESFADPGFARALALGGCAMLQFGVETASPRMMDRIGKGGDAERARRVLRACASAGIRNHVYLVFGLPEETDEDRESTLAFVEGERASIHAVNPSLLNLPKGSPMHRRPERFGITEIRAFHADTDLSLYDDFLCGSAHPRSEARRWIASRLLRSKAMKAIQATARTPFKANHLCFL